jgi:hypothetical protein
MQPQYVTDLTVSELETLIAREIQRQLLALREPQHVDMEALKAARQYIDERRWSLPAGSPSVAELVRRERDGYIGKH